MTLSSPDIENILYILTTKTKLMRITIILLKMDPSTGQAWSSSLLWGWRLLLLLQCHTPDRPLRPPAEGFYFQGPIREHLNYLD